jgi:hypothetical protein
VSYADVTVDGEVTLTGAVDLVIADLKVKCTVLSGGPAQGRSFYRVCSGAAGWGKNLPSKSYTNDAGVKLSTILNDAATECGETFDTSTIPSTTVGSYYTRTSDRACRSLEIETSRNWYVGEDGKTRIGQRPTGVLKTSSTTVSQIDLARGTVTITTDTIANVLPGIQVSGLTAVDVEHEVTPEGGLRTTIWGQQTSGNARRIAAIAAILEQLDAGRRFRGVWEYRIVTQDPSGRLNVQPTRVSSGMPSLNGIKVRPGVGGVKAMYSLGSRVLVSFVNADPGQPVVTSFEDEESGSFVPTMTNIAGGGNPVARTGDQVMVFLPPTLPIVGTVSGNPLAGTITIANPVTGLITGGSAKVTSG